MSKQSRRPPQEEKPARRSWRGEVQNGSSARAPATQTGWRQGRAPRNYLARKWLIGIPMIVVVLGLFFGWYAVTFRLPLPTPLVMAYVTRYESPLEPHAFAQEDVEQLLELFRSAGESGSISVRGAAAGSEIKATDKDRFLAEFKEDLLAQQPARRLGENKPQLIYLSAQGVVNSAGEPCIVVAAGDRDVAGGTIRTPRQVLADERLVRIDDLVEVVSQVHEHAHKVLLLDCIRSNRNWRLGIAANEFVSLLPSIKLDTPARQKVVILHACSPGEAGLVDLRKGRTLFGEYVARGLAGEANTDSDDYVNLREFHAYLQEQLQAAAARRGRTQQPLLVASSDNLDFSLATANSAVTSAASEQFQRAAFQPAASWLDEIHAGWAAFAERRMQAGASPAAGSLLIDEAQRQHWQQQLKYCLGGQAYANYREAFSTKAVSGGLAMPAVSLPLAVGHLDLPTDEEQRARAALVPPPVDQPKPEHASPPASAKEYHAMASVVWSDALQGFAAADFASAKLREAQSGALGPVELRTLERFHPQNAHLPKTVRDSSDILRQFLVCRHEAERAAYVHGQPRVLPLVHARLDQADSERRALEDAAFGGQMDGEALDRLQQQFKAIQTEAASVAAAFSVRDRIWADLPFLLEWAVVGGMQEQAQALMEGLAALERAFAAPASQATDWPKLTSKLEVAERELMKSYTEQWVANVKRTPAEGVHSQVPALERLLAAPLANLEARQELWKKYWGVVAGPTAAERPANYAQEAARVAQEQPAAVKLLDLWLSIVPAQSEADTRRLPAAAQFLGIMDAAAAAIVPLDAKAVDDNQLREQLAHREPLGRAAASWLTLAPDGSLGRHVIGQRSELAAYDYCHWQARRSLEDFLGNEDRLAAGGSSAPQGAADERPYFVLAAGQLLAHAERLFPERKAAVAVRELLESRERDAGLLSSVVLDWPKEPLATGENFALVDRLPQPLDVQSLPRGQAALRASGEWKQVARSDASSSPAPITGDVLLPVTASDSGWPARFQFTLDAAGSEQSSASGELGYYYRGHAATSRGHIDRLQPRYRVVSVSPGDQGKLAVDSPTVRAKIVILLDCSESMKVPSGRERSRLERGKKAVHATIRELLALNDDRAASEVQVALVLFAHRRKLFTWPRAGEKSDISWNAAFNPEEPDVSYDRDFAVEWVSSKNKVKDGEALDKLLLDIDNKANPRIVPTGFTPLYAAMDFALTSGFEKLGGRDDVGGQVPLHLLVVSDGEDDVPTIRELAIQSNVSPAQYPVERFVPAWNQNYNSPASRSARSERINQKLSQDINLYFFDFAGGGALQQVAKDLNLRDEQIVPISPDVDLAPELLRRIGVRNYAVIDGERGSRQHGSSTRPETFDRLPGPHKLVFAPDDSFPANFRIAGGEALQVTIPASVDQPAIFVGHPADGYDDAARGAITLDPALNDTVSAYEVVCRGERERRGERNDQACRFELVLQNKALGKFTPRPVELWAEIVPLNQSGMPLDKFSFCSPFPVKGTRTPVYELTVPDWPPGSTQANVNVWVRMQASSWFQSPQVTSQTHAQRKPASNGGLPGVEFKFEAREEDRAAIVTITESFNASASGDPLHFVRLEAELGVTRVERTYYNGQVEHEFVLADRRLDDALATRVLAIPQERWKKDAAGLDNGSPLVVTITDE
jgi:hypothetical protein